MYACVYRGSIFIYPYMYAWGIYIYMCTYTYTYIPIVDYMEVLYKVC